MASYVWPPSGGGGGGGVDVYPSIGAFPVTAPDGTLGLAADTGILYYFETDSNSWVPIGGPGVALDVGAFDSGVASPDGAHIDANALIMQSASITDPGLVNTVAQTFAGHKTFQDGLTGTLTGHATLDEPIILPGLVTDYWRGDKTFQPLVTSAVGAINLVGSPSFNTLDGQLDRIISSGVTDGGVLTDNLDGTVSIAAATAYLTTNLVVSSVTRVGNVATVTTAVAHSYITGNYIVLIGAVQPEYNGLFLCTVTGPTTFTYFVSGTPVTPATGVMNVTSENSPVNICSVPAVANLPLVDHITNYIFVDFNLGSPIFASTIDPSTIFGLSRVNCWTVAREGNQIWYLDNRQINLDTPNRVNRKHIQTNPFAPAINTSILSASGTRNFKVSAGGFWDGLNKTLQAAFDTSGTSTFTYASTANNGLTWTYQPGQTQINNTQYNNVSTGLVPLTAGNYGVHWVYVMCSVPCTLIVVYGQGDYTKSQAFSSLEPTLLPNIISLTNIGITSASPGLGVLVGRIIVQDGAAVFSDTTSSFINVFPNLNPTLDSLADVQAANPNVNDVLSWNGANWVNAEVGTAVSAGAVNYFDATPVLTAVGPNNANLVTTLSPIPITSAEQTKTTALTTNTLVAQAMRAANPIGRTSIDAGNWTFTQYAGVNSVAAGRVTTVTRNIYQVIPETGMTATMAGAGLTRTLVVTGGTPFVAGDANASIPLGSYVRTPLGLFKITAFTSSSQVTVAVPVTYVNEIAFTFSKWNRLFGIISPAITSISPTYNAVVFGTTQPAFPVNPTDFLGSILFGTSNNTTTLTNVYNGSTHNSNMVTPLNILHNDLLGLQGGTSGEYFHLTNADYNDVINADAANVFDTIVKRDVGGNFAASTLSIAGASVSGLTASQAVVTDPSKILTSLAYTDAASGSTIVSRDSNGDSSFNEVTANILNGNLGGGAKGSIPIQTGTDATNMHGSMPDYWSLVPDQFQPDGWRNAAFSATNGKPGKNYVQYADFENSQTVGWTLGTTGTLTNGIPTGVPTFGSGASGNLSLTVETNSPLSGSASLNFASNAPTTVGDMFASNLLFADRSDRAKVLSFKFNYELISGTGNFSGSSANSFGVAVWDLATSSWLAVSGCFSMIQSAGVGIAQGTFQTNINTQAFRLVVYNVTVTAGAITMLYDDFYVGPQNVGRGPAMDDVKSYIPTISASFGTPTGVAFYSRRVGDSLEVYGTFTAGTVSAATASVSIGYNGSNANVTIDPSKIALLTIVGKGTAGSSSSATYFGEVSVLGAPGGSTLTFGVHNSAINPLFAANANAFVANNQPFTFFARLPISGFSSNTVLSSDSDTRVVAMRAGGTPTGTLSASTNIIKYPTIFNDTHAGYSPVTGLYTCSVSGFYDISAEYAIVFSSSSANQLVDIMILLNGTTPVARYDHSIAGGITAFQPGASILGVFCPAGTTIGIYSATNVGAPSFLANSYFTVAMRSGPATIAASEDVNGRYTNTAGQSLITNANNTIINWTKDYDSHNIFNPTTGIGIIPVSGKYLFSVSFLINALAAGNSYATELYKNNVKLSTFFNNTAAGVTSGMAGSDQLPFLSGDTFKIIVLHNNVSAQPLFNGAGYNHVSWTRVGN